MAERRSLMAGLEVVPPNVDPDTLRSFITQEPPANREATVPAEPSPEKRPTKASVTKRALVPSLHATLLVPVTVRLKPAVADALKRASLQRQLNGVETYTQQDIVEEALVPWSRAEGLYD